MTTSFDFPTTPSAYDPTYNGSHDLFVAKLAFHMQSRLCCPLSALTLCRESRRPLRLPGSAPSAST